MKDNQNINIISQHVQRERDGICNVLGFLEHIMLGAGKNVNSYHWIAVKLLVTRFPHNHI